MTDFIAITSSLFFVINSLGNIPVFLGLIGRYDMKKQRVILFREFGAALGILLLFVFCGDRVLFTLGISREIIGVAGGLLLLLIAISMIFPKPNEEAFPREEPMIVPMAIPLLSGPGSITAVMVYTEQTKNYLLMTSSIFTAIILSLTVILCACSFKRFLGPKSLSAISRLGGMIIALISCQMIASGMIELVRDKFQIKCVNIENVESLPESTEN